MMNKLPIQICWITIFASVPITGIVSSAILWAILTGEIHTVAPIAWLYFKILVNLTAICMLCIWHGYGQEPIAQPQK